MKIHYDRDTDTRVISQRDERIKESDEVLPGVIADSGYEGGVVPFEILDASKHVSDRLSVTLATLRHTVLAAFLASAPAFAQSDNPYDGTWTISFDGPKTVNLQGTVVISGSGGTWDIVAQARGNPCIGREYPITIRRATADELTFTVERGATLTGCRDSTYTFKKVDDKTLKGELDGGRAAVLRKR